jgi:hypothetical protein
MNLKQRILSLEKSVMPITSTCSECGFGFFNRPQRPSEGKCLTFKCAECKQVYYQRYRFVVITPEIIEQRSKNGTA